MVSETSHRLIEIFFARTSLRKDPGADEKGAIARKVERVAVLGGGLHGRRHRRRATLGAGISVRLKDKDDASLGRGHLADMLDEHVKRSRSARRTRRRLSSSGTTDYSGIRQADLVIEAVFEDLA